MTMNGLTPRGFPLTQEIKFIIFHKQRTHDNMSLSLPTMIIHNIEITGETTMMFLT